MDFQHIRAGKHFCGRAVAMGEAEGLAFCPVPKRLFTFPVGLDQVKSLLFLLFPLTRLVAEPTLDRPHHQVFDKPGGLVDQMCPVPKPILKLFFMSLSNGNPVRDDKHSVFSSAANILLCLHCKRVTKEMEALPRLNTAVSLLPPRLKGVLQREHRKNAPAWKAFGHSHGCVQLKKAIKSGSEGKVSQTVYHVCRF